MASYTDVFSMYPEEFDLLKGVTPPHAEIVPTKPAWYDNSGMWAEVGKVGAALLSGQQSPSLKGLAAAGNVASEYHAAKQLDKASTKMLANVAGGKAPMAGFETGDTKGLTPAQVEGLNKTGLAKVEQDSQIASRKKDIEYKDAMIGEIDAKRKEKETKIKMWDDTMKGWEDGTMKKPSFISDEMVPMIKGLGQEKGEAIISDLIKITKQNPDMHIITDKEKGKVIGVNKETGIKKWEMDITPDKHDPKVVAANRKDADNMAFAEMLPALRDSYSKAMGVAPESKAKLDTLMATLNSPDPIAAANAKTTLLGYAGPDLLKQYKNRANIIDRSITEGKGYPDVDSSTPGAGQDVTIKGAGGKQKVDMSLVSKAAAAAKLKAAKENRPPTPIEIQTEYEALLNSKGGKK